MACEHPECTFLHRFLPGDRVECTQEGEYVFTRPGVLCEVISVDEEAWFDESLVVRIIDEDADSDSDEYMVNPHLFHRVFSGTMEGRKQEITDLLNDL